MTAVRSVAWWRLDCAVIDVHARHPRVVVVAAATLGGVVAKAVIGGDNRAWAYAVVLAGVCAIGALVGAHGRLSGRTLALLVGLGIVHVVGGLAPNPGQPGVSFYEYWVVDDVLKVDQLVHAGGSAIVAVAFAELLVRWLNPATTTRRLRWVLAGLMACGVGALNEVFEYLLSLRLDHLRVGDAANTGWDLVFNLAGVIAVGVAGCAAAPAGRSVGLPRAEDIGAQPVGRQ